MSEQNLPVIGEIVHIPEAGEGVICRTVPGFNGYAAGNDGSIWSQHKNRHGLVGSYRRLKGYVQKGYVIHAMSNNRFEMGHRLVLTAFVGQRPDGMETLHGNGIRADNRVDNLRWGTGRENTEDAKRHGTFRRGEMCSRLTERQVVAMRESYAAGRLEQAELAKTHGLSIAQASKILTGIAWSHVGGPIVCGRDIRKARTRQKHLDGKKNKHTKRMPKCDAE